MMSEEIHYARRMLAKNYNYETVIGDRLAYLSAAIWSILNHLEAQERAASASPTDASREQPATTASPTTAEEWAAEDFILRQTLRLWQLDPADMASLVERLFRSAARLGVLPDDGRILALAAQARRSISQRAASSSCAAPY